MSSARENQNGLNDHKAIDARLNAEDHYNIFVDKKDGDGQTANKIPPTANKIPPKGHFRPISSATDARLNLDPNNHYNILDDVKDGDGQTAAIPPNHSRPTPKDEPKASDHATASGHRYDPYEVRIRIPLDEQDPQDTKPEVGTETARGYQKIPPGDSDQEQDGYDLDFAVRGFLAPYIARQKNIQKLKDRIKTREEAYQGTIKQPDPTMPQQVPDEASAAMHAYHESDLKARKDAIKNEEKEANKILENWVKEYFSVHSVDKSKHEDVQNFLIQSRRYLEEIYPAYKRIREEHHYEALDKTLDEDLEIVEARKYGNDDYEKYADFLELKKVRENLLDMLVKHEIEHDPERGGWLYSYKSEKRQFILALSTEFFYTLLNYNMLVSGVAIPVIQIFGIRDLTIARPVIKSTAGFFSLQTFLANILSLSPHQAARGERRKRIEDPNRGWGHLMRQKMILAFLMVNHFCDGGYLNVMPIAEDEINILGFQVQNPLVYIKVPLLLYIMATSVKFYFGYSGEDVLIGDGNEYDKKRSLWSRYWENSSLVDICQTLCRSNKDMSRSDKMRRVMADVWIFLMHQLTISQHVINFMLGGYEFPEQVHNFAPFIPHSNDSMNMASAIYAGACAYFPRELTRGPAFDSRFRNPYLPPSIYDQAKAVYEQEQSSWENWFLTALKRLFLSPSTVANLALGYLAGCRFAQDEIGEGTGYSLALLMVYLFSYQAATMEDIMKKVKELKLKEQREKNPSEEKNNDAAINTTAYSFTWGDNIGRIMGTVVAAAIVKIGHGFFENGDLEKILQAPQQSLEFWLLLYAGSTMLSIASIPYQQGKTAETLADHAKNLSKSNCSQFFKSLSSSEARRKGYQELAGDEDRAKLLEAEGRSVGDSKAIISGVNTLSEQRDTRIPMAQEGPEKRPNTADQGYNPNASLLVRSESVVLPEATKAANSSWFGGLFGGSNNTRVDNDAEADNDAADLSAPVQPRTSSWFDCFSRKRG